MEVKMYRNKVEIKHKKKDTERWWRRETRRVHYIYSTHLMVSGTDAARVLILSLFSTLFLH